MEPLTGALLLITWFATRSGEEFAAEFGKEMYGKASPLVDRLFERLSNRKDSTDIIPELKQGKVTDQAKEAIEEIIKSDTVLSSQLNEVSSKLTAKQYEYVVNQEFEEAEDVVGFKAPSESDTSSHVTQRFSKGNKIRGIELL